MYTDISKTETNFNYLAERRQTLVTN